MGIKPSITFPRQFCSHCQSNSLIDTSLHLDHTWMTSSAAGCLLHCRRILYCLSHQESPLLPPSPAKVQAWPQSMIHCWWREGEGELFSDAPISFSCPLSSFHPDPLLMEGGGGRAFLWCTHLFFLSSFFLSSPIPLPSLFTLASRVDLSGTH